MYLDKIRGYKARQAEMLEEMGRHQVREQGVHRGVLERTGAAYDEGDGKEDAGVEPAGEAPVRRVDQAWGDRNLFCACPPPEAFE